MIKREIVASLSVAQVGRCLQQAALQPDRSKMWLNTTEKNPERFEREAATVCQTYLEAPRKAAIDGTHTVSVDEATRREFLSDVSDRIRFVYLPKHSSWLNQIEIFFGIAHRKCLRGGNFTSAPDLESQLREFITYDNTTMAHPFNWTYTGKPLQKRRRAHFVPPHHRVKMRGQHEPPSLTPS